MNQDEFNLWYASVTGNEEERARFEAWAKTHIWLKEYKLRRYEATHPINGCYIDLQVAAAWDAWLHLKGFS